MKHLSWDDLTAAADGLAGRVVASDFAPEFLVGITTGGLIPLTFMAKRLGVHDVLTIYAKSYDGQEQKGLEIKYRPAVDLKNRRVLLVDEIADSGATLRAVSKIFAEEYGADLKTLTFVRKNTCTFEPDFWAIPTDEWVVFPWDEKKSTE
jgi:hypoxanthine phosphoribosyltransferase